MTVEFKPLEWREYTEAEEPYGAASAYTMGGSRLWIRRSTDPQYPFLFEGLGYYTLQQAQDAAQSWHNKQVAKWLIIH